MSEESLSGGSCCDNSFEGFKDFVVSLRDIKGYNGEVFVKNCLDKLNVSYVSNPLDNIQVWKQFQKCGSDFKIESYNIELEVKNIDGKVFRSWILRDWIPRFSFKGERRITAIPESTKLPITSLEVLFTYDIYIVYYDSLKYIIPNRGNKLCSSSKASSRSIETVSNAEISSSSEEISASNVKGGIEKDQTHEFETTFKASNSETNCETVQNSSGNSKPSSYGNNEIQQSKLVDFLSPREQYKVKKREWLKNVLKNFIPSCQNCTARHYCRKRGTTISRDGISYFLSSENFNEVINCLKRRVYLTSRFGFDLFEIDRKSYLFYDGIEQFWRILNRGELYKLGLGSIEMEIDRGQTEITDYLQGWINYANQISKRID